MQDECLGVLVGDLWTESDFIKHIDDDADPRHIRAYRIQSDSLYQLSF